MNLGDIAKKIEGSLIGESIEISGLSLLEDVKANSLVYVQDKRFLAKAEGSMAAAIIVPQSISQSTKPLIQVKNAKVAFFALFELFYPKKAFRAHTSSRASIADDVHLPDEVSIAANVVVGKGCQIGQHVILHPGVVLGENVTLSDGVILHANVSVYDNTVIGKNTVIHANTVIGSDGFGYVFDGKAHQKIPHVGRVVIGENVEIGSNTSIDRATMGETQIGDGSKIDNLVQIAHNVKLGKNNIVCAYTGIAGSSRCGNNVILAANVGIADQVTIEDNVILGPRSGVASGKTIKAGSKMLGAPARDMEKAMEIMMTAQRLPQIRKLVQDLQKRVKHLEKEQAS